MNTIEYVWNPDKLAIEAGCEDDCCPTVGRCAEVGERAIAAEVEDSRSFDERVTDVLTDIFHACDKHGLDAEDLVESALYHWREER